MMVPANAQRREFAVWDLRNPRDYSPVKSHLPVLEETMTPLGRGPSTFGATIVSLDDVSLVRVTNNTLCLGTSVLDPAYLAYLVVVPIKNECHVNGEVVQPSAIFMPGEQDGFYIHGADRISIAMTFRKEKLRAMLAALQGIAPDDVSLTSPRLELHPEVVARTRWRMIDLLDQCSREDVPGAMGRQPLKLVDEIFSLAGDIYLASRINVAQTEPRSLRSPERIVRMAEEYFFAADGEPISLADLCKATGVGKTTLYTAFANICGVPPLSYFHKRRLMQARSNLLNSDAKWGAVKRAALSAGLTELGRFSVEYRQLFGESPSATLRQVQ